MHHVATKACMMGSPRSSTWEHCMSTTAAAESGKLHQQQPACEPASIITILMCAGTSPPVHMCMCVCVWLQAPWMGTEHNRHRASHHISTAERVMDTTFTTCACVSMCVSIIPPSTLRPLVRFIASHHCHTPSHTNQPPITTHIPCVRRVQLARVASILDNPSSCCLRVCIACKCGCVRAPAW